MVEAIQAVNGITWPGAIAVVGMSISLAWVVVTFIRGG